jgi:hypothetical protein
MESLEIVSFRPRIRHRSGCDHSDSAVDTFSRSFYSIEIPRLSSPISV